MLRTASAGWAIGMAILLVGCSTRTAPRAPDSGRVTGADAEHVTLHVKDMAKLLKLV
ncbi:MAG TPA: hypothetical protein VKE94_08290 [Gemmataceae bacterium]|nr:hypothetical protein [Gemmataceae bacterium]